MDQPELIAAFKKEFGSDPEIVTVAPGRINLAGEHTDYNEGFVFPAAIDRVLRVAARIANGPTRLTSVQEGKAKEFDATSVEPGQVEDWAKYPAGMAWALRDKGKLPNVEGLVDSEIPIGSGVSSSAALELAFGVLYNDLAQLGIDNKDLALLGQKDENRFVGVQSGIMDQMASAMGREGHAIFLDTRSLDIRYVKIPENLAIAVCDTKTHRSLTDSAYNERRSQCEEAARILGVKALRDATMELLNERKDDLTDVIYRRARHVITEDARCQETVDAMSSNQTESLGQLMRKSHESLRDDYEVSSRELDLMVEAAWQAPGCVGARMSGAGFGGACVALVEKTDVYEFIETVNLAYRESSGIEGEIRICRAVNGARVLWRN